MTRLPFAILGMALLMLSAMRADSASARASRDRNVEEEARIAACIRHAADGRPWLEKTLWGLRDQEGGWVGAEVVNRDGSHDLGPMQINSWWVSRVANLTGRPAQHIRYWLIHDACFNVDVARWIFLSGLVATGDYWKAIGIYHSPTSWRQRRYTGGVIRYLQRRFGTAIFARSCARVDQHSLPGCRGH